MHTKRICYFIRPGAAEDLADVAAIQAASPEAAQCAAGGLSWPRFFGFAFSIEPHRGFAVSRSTGPDERELLNLAVRRSFAARSGRRAGTVAGNGNRCFCFFWKSASPIGALGYSIEHWFFKRWA